MSGDPGGLRICGRLEGIVLEYDALAGRTPQHREPVMFRRGVFDRWTSSLEEARRIPLWYGHNPRHDAGRVTALDDVEVQPGAWALRMRADVFDTPRGRELFGAVARGLAVGKWVGLSPTVKFNGAQRVTIGDRRMHIVDQVEAIIEISLVQEAVGGFGTRVTKCAAVGQR